MIIVSFYVATLSSTILLPLIFSPLTSKLGYQQTTIAITEEAEVMREGVVVNRVPVAFDKGADQQQQGALRLVEVRDQHLHDLVFIARGNDDLRTAMESSLVVTVEP